MTITEKAKQKLDTTGKEIKEAVDSLKMEVEELTQKVKEKLKGAGKEMKGTAQELTQEVRNLTEKVSNLIPQKKKSPSLSVHKTGPALSERDLWERPFLELQKATNRLFDDFFSGVGLSQIEKQDLWGLTTDVWGRQWPYVDMSENEREILITAELPGVKKNHIDISISKNAITIRGEKDTQEEEKGRGYHRVERSYGSFKRSFLLPCEVEESKVEASFKDGILRVIMPKTAEARERIKKIEVRAV